MLGSIAQLMALILAGVWLIIVGYILWKYVLKKRFSSRKKYSRSHRRTGKRCPQCKNLIDSRRTVCQHCGQVFPSVPKPEAEAKPQNGPSGKKHKRGKRCPQCQAMVDYQRDACQHCGYVFFEARQDAPSPNLSPPSDSSGDGI